MDTETLEVIIQNLLEGTEEGSLQWATASPNNADGARSFRLLNNLDTDPHSVFVSDASLTLWHARSTLLATCRPSVFPQVSQLWELLSGRSNAPHLEQIKEMVIGLRDKGKGGN